ncbi:MAG: ribose-phosphate pyrophosphokinase [Ruminococcus sp.]|nr:ribose-phosphate pyrophosphokinase [Ruminococcus sp.]MBE6862788.1 ribose-phosphate pyrophosphokinase [Ruminococcus sp.]MBR6791574.1 ribose-phosphate pyrophosphokinase [Ruminococcus sp.]
MLKINGSEIVQGSFPDGTLLVKYAPEKDLAYAEIDWYYENDRELVTLIYLTKHLNAHGINRVKLFMPYIPNARQDRVKSDEDVFTMKYFAQVINWLGFESVTVLDPHSTVSEALIDRIAILTPKENVRRVISEITRSEGAEPFMFYPDEGASKRYSGMVTLPYGFGIKKRDWKTGKILGLDVSGSVEQIKGKSVLIVDDICSKGGTFLFSAKKLKELGAGNIYLYISHCEKTILNGELLTSGLISKIYTTDSICNFRHELINIMPCKKGAEDYE